MPLGQLAGIAIQKMLDLHVDCLGTRPLRPLFLRLHTGHLQRERGVLLGPHVRIQAVVLEDHGDLALLRGHAGAIVFVEEHAPGSRLLQACDGAQGRGIAAP